MPDFFCLRTVQEINLLSKQNRVSNPCLVFYIPYYIYILYILYIIFNFVLYNFKACLSFTSVYTCEFLEVFSLAGGRHFYYKYADPIQINIKGKKSAIPVRPVC